MALREELERTGNWLFRWRSYLPMALAVPLVLATWDPDYAAQDRQLPDYWGLGCLAFSLLGLALRIMVVAHVPEGTSGRNAKAGQLATELNTTGMYSVVRHPLYLANYLVWLGVALFCRLWWMPVVFTLTFAAFYGRIMFAEEEFLRRRFRQTYLRWARRTPAFLPRFQLWRKPTLPFDYLRVIRREHPTVFGIISCFYALEAYDRVIMRHDWTVSVAWTSILAIGAVAYVTLAIMKRKAKFMVVAPLPVMEEEYPVFKPRRWIPRAASPSKSQRRAKKKSRLAEERIA